MSPDSAGDSADRSALLEAAVRAVADACAVCRQVQRDLSDADSMAKRDRSPVTVADFASQAVIVRRLGELLGECSMIAEEHADALRRDDAGEIRSRVVEAARAVWPGASEADVLDAIDQGSAASPTQTVGGFWTLDPIDGTKGFLRGEQYAVSLAWIEGSEPVVGVLGCPAMSLDFDRPFDVPDPRGAIYAAADGLGVFVAPADSQSPAPAPVSRPATPLRLDALRVCESVESDHTSGSDRERVMEQVGRTEQLLRLDGQGKYAVVARDQADAYLRLPTRRDYVERIWDHAAGDIVAREAGRVVTDIRGQRLDFSHGAGLEANRGVVCADAGVHSRIIDAIAHLGLHER